MISKGFKDVGPIQDSEKIDDNMLHVNSIAGLIQAIGYIKYVVADKGNKYGVAFRGQCKTYSSLKPTLYRNVTKTSAKPTADSQFEDLLKSVSVPQNKSLAKYLHVSEEYIEPLLQHYGIKTKWLDLVDNIWVALWFACHRYIGETKPLINFISRPFEYKGDAISRGLKRDKDDHFCYIILMRVPIGADTSSHVGHYCGDDSEVIDARYCIPSFYLRPHMQHGLLLRAKSNKKGGTAIDFYKLIEGTIRIDLKNALEWVGQNHITTASLFPPPYIDDGLKLLLKIDKLYNHLDIPTA